MRLLMLLLSSNPTSKRLDPWPRGVVSDEGEPHPIADANVVIFFIDGLRPDVAIEMAQMGHMPTFRDLFMDGGTYVENAFSVLPSLTDTNFASMMTGTFSDKHGIKTSYYFDREKQGFVNNLNKYSYPRLAKQRLFRSRRLAGAAPLAESPPGKSARMGSPVAERC